ncbi:MAG: hypothetical protein J0665_20360 [Deltaproteobacteria bacterium]|nr:hypothetical protein [Deltaproteobacteria bacterium]
MATTVVLSKNINALSIALLLSKITWHHPGAIAKPRLTGRLIRATYIFVEYSGGRSPDPSGRKNLPSLEKIESIKEKKRQ